MSQRFLQVEIPVPPYFLCPISLELMRDPVTISSGQTFDRSSIEKWLDDGHSSCPITRQLLQVDEEPIPNHVLRRMMQAWCVENRSLGIERISTPRQPASLTEIGKLVHEINDRSVDLLDTLHMLSRIAQTHPRTRKHMLKAGVLSALALSLKCGASSFTCSRPNFDCFTPRRLDKAGETLRLLALLNETDGAASFWEPTHEQISGVAWFVARGKAVARQNAALVLSGIQISEDTKRNIGVMEGFMGGLLQVITEPLSPNETASTAGLKLLLRMCSGTRNRILATEAGAVDALVGKLASESGKTTTELVSKGLEALCGCAEGRAAMCESSRGIEEIVRAMGRVSERTTRHAMETLWVVLKLVPSSSQAKRRAVKAGALLKVMVVAESGASSQRTATTARRTIRALSEVLAGPLLDRELRL